MLLDRVMAYEFRQTVVFVIVPFLKLSLNAANTRRATKRRTILESLVDQQVMDDFHHKGCAINPLVDDEHVDAYSFEVSCRVGA